MIIGITGTLAAGKGVVSDILKKRGFKHYSVRNFLIKEIILRGMPVNRDSMVKVANDLRAKFSPSYIVEELYKQAKKQGENCIIESIRAVGEAQALKEKGNFILIAVDADQKKRYERIVGRKSETDRISYEEFISNENREMVSNEPAKQSIAKVMEMADFKIINNGSIEEIKRDVGQILEIVTKKENQAVVENEKTQKEIIQSQPEVKIQQVTKKRDNYISWDEYFMGVSILSGKRSKDPNTQVGACIVNPDKKIVGTGYNGFPIGCSDDEFPWARKGEFIETKYPYVVHAELNAILNSIKSLKDCTIYVALFPCNECAKAIIQSGIKKVFYLSDKYKNENFTIAAKKMFDAAGVTYVQLIPKTDKICLEFLED